ncbi:MAG: WYL domain-containing protein [Proteocatella sp.]
MYTIKHNSDRIKLLHIKKRIGAELMSKVGNALKMLSILKNRGKASRKELAEILEVSEREVSRYRDDLESAGLNIKETRGRYGGYELVGREYLLDMSLSKDEVKSLNLMAKQIDKSSFPYIKEIETAIEKLNCISDVQNPNNLEFIMKSNHTIQDYGKEKIKWQKINDARISRKKIILSYENFSGEKSERVVRPYGINFYQGAYYLIGYCEKRNEIRQFKFIRIYDIKTLNDLFEMDGNFSLKTYLSDSLGIYKDGTLDIKLKIFYPYAQYFKENKWVENEQYEDFYEKGHLIYTAKMEGKTQIESWILQMGNNCIVMEPRDLRNGIIKIYKKSLENY